MNITFRTQFYKTDQVQCITAPSSDTFEMLEARLQLTSSRPCTPSIATDFNKATGLPPFEFSVDECHVVSAALVVNNSESDNVANIIRHKFPRLSFFSTSVAGTNQVEIRIPGTNLSEQREPLKSGLKM